MKLSDFDYTYPEELVAQRPLSARDASKMMVVRRGEKTFEHSSFSRFPEYLKEGDVLVVNDTKVFPARLIGKRESGGGIEVLLLAEYHPERCHPERPEGAKDSPTISRGIRSTARDDNEQTTRDDRRIWRAIATRKKRLKPGDKIYFCDELSAEVLENNVDELLIEFFIKSPLTPLFQRGDFEKLIMKIGLPPLPPYIKRKIRGDYTDEDRERYQTIYARNTGSAAAPTAGFHLTEDIVKKCKDKGVEMVPVTLHVGMDTFSPVRVEKIEEHRMHGEEYFIGEDSAKAILKAKQKGRRVVAIGTTTVRALESIAPLLCKEGKGEVDRDLPHPHPPLTKGRKNLTHLFITPGYKFCVVDTILTNFHQPRSTLLMMISAFAGREFILQMYEEAIKSRYRLFSYGDCMLLV